MPNSAQFIRRCSGVSQGNVYTGYSSNSKQHFAIYFVKGMTKFNDDIQDSKRCVVVLIYIVGNSFCTVKLLLLLPLPRFTF